MVGFSEFKQDTFKGFTKKYVYQVIDFYKGESGREHVYPEEHPIYFDSRKDGIKWLKEQADIIFNCNKHEDMQIEFPIDKRKMFVFLKGWGLITFYKRNDLKPQFISDEIDIETGIPRGWYTNIEKTEILYKKEDK